MSSAQNIGKYHTDGLGIIGTAIVIFLCQSAISIIQADPVFAKVFIEDFSAKPLGILLYAVVGTIFGLGFSIAFGMSPIAVVKQIIDELRQKIGYGPAVFVVGSLLLPQRLMDNNSAFTFIPPESSLAGLMFALDLNRALYSFIMFKKLILVDWKESQKKWGLHSPLLLAFVGAVFQIIVQVGVIGNIPRVDDEIIQDWHARMLAQGEVRAPLNPCGPSFAPDVKISFNGRRLFSTYQPGLSLIWSVIYPLGIVGCVNPILNLLAILCFFYLLQKHYGRNVANAAILLFVFSPFANLMATSRMNHTLASLLSIICGIGISLAGNGGNAAGGLLFGLASGFAVMTRRVDGISLCLAGFLAFLTMKTDFRKKAVFGTIAVATLLIIYKIQTALSLVHTGDSLLALRHPQNMLAKLLEMPPGILAANIIDNIFGFNAYAFGGLIAGFMGFGFLRMRGNEPAVLIEKFFALQALFVFCFYGLYEYQDFCFGPRFFFCLLPAAVLGTAKMIEAFQFFVPVKNLRSWLLMGGAFGILMMTHQIRSNLGNHFWNIDRQLETYMDKTIPQPSIVFIRNPTRIRAEIARRLAAMKASKEIILNAISESSLDYDALLEDFSKIDNANITEAVNCLARRREKSRYQRPEDYDINPFEVVRLNSADPLNQKIVLALDLGDEANEKLISRLPDHKPFLIWKRRKEFFSCPYGKAGIQRFDE